MPIDGNNQVTINPDAPSDSSSIDNQVNYQIELDDLMVQAAETIAFIQSIYDTLAVVGGDLGSLDVQVRGEDVSDVRRAVEVTLKEVDRTFGDVYANDAGHIELQYTARASYACQTAFGAEYGRAFGLIVGAPAAIGVVMADTAVKAANVTVVGYASPGNGGTSHSNEAILFISGDSGAVRQSVISAREVGLALLGSMGDEPTNSQPSYI